MRTITFLALSILAISISSTADVGLVKDPRFLTCEVKSGQSVDYLSVDMNLNETSQSLGVGHFQIQIQTLWDKKAEMHAVTYLLSAHGTDETIETSMMIGPKVDNDYVYSAAGSLGEVDYSVFCGMSKSPNSLVLE